MSLGIKLMQTHFLNFCTFDMSWSLNRFQANNIIWTITNIYTKYRVGDIGLTSRKSNSDKCIVAMTSLKRLISVIGLRKYMIACLKRKYVWELEIYGQNVTTRNKLYFVCVNCMDIILSFNINQLEIFSR